MQKKYIIVQISLTVLMLVSCQTHTQVTNYKEIMYLKYICNNFLNAVFSNDEIEKEL